MFGRNNNRKTKTIAVRTLKISQPAQSIFSSRVNKQPQGRRPRKRLWLVGIAAAVIVVVLAMQAIENNVLGLNNSAPASFRVKLVNPPAWMPLALYKHLCDTLTPDKEQAYDPDLTEKLYERYAGNVWIREVQKVKRCKTDANGVAVIELQAKIRKPVAKIDTLAGSTYLDADAIRLPAKFAPQWVGHLKLRDGSSRQVCFINRSDVPAGMHVRPVHYMVISGAEPYAPSIGKKWEGDDIADGLKLIALLTKKQYANQITVVDVRNHAGRISHQEPHIVMRAQIGRGIPTEIRFGRFPRPNGDTIVYPVRKLSYLDEYAQRNNGRLAGLNAYLDLRNDQLHISVH